RDNVQPGDPLLLIVENDLPFARLLLEVAREKGFKGLVTSLGAAALAMTRDFKPDAVTLDICLPDIDGWRVMDRLKNDMATRHIPVCVISTEEACERAASYGALRVLTKPLQNRETLEHLLDEVRDCIGRRVKDVVIVGRDEGRRDEILRSIGGEEVEVTTTQSGREALDLLVRKRVDCLVLDDSMPDMTPDEFLRRARGEARGTTLPVILYSDRP